MVEGRSGRGEMEKWRGGVKKGEGGGRRELHQIQVLQTRSEVIYANY